jgi:hypothetical protein
VRSIGALGASSVEFWAMGESLTQGDFVNYEGMAEWFK